MIGIDHFGARTGAAAWVFIWAVFGDEFGKSDRKTVGPRNLQPLEQDTKTILEAARLCGFRNLSEVPRKYHEHISSAEI